MKFLKLAGIFIGTFIIGFLVLSAFASRSIDVSSSCEITAEVDSVWNILTDTARYRQWKANLVDMQYVEGNPGSVGFRLRTTYRPYEDDLVMYEKITEIDVHRKLIYELTADKLLIEDRVYKLELIDSFTTRLSVARHIEAGNWFVKFLLPRMKEDFANQSDEECKHIGALLDI